ncbi:MAG: hypothetical protein NTV38_02150 [Chloroflexi bacterium]|nr:hypothetical protein [Chloroflexota bacterium]
MPATKFRRILENHLLRYPQMQIADLYKLLHQAALGSEHAVRDEQAARDWLESELVEMGDGPDDPLIDPLSPDGQILRVHLRPYYQAGKKSEMLLQAFIQTANEWRSTPPRAPSGDRDYLAVTGTTTEKLKEYFREARQLADEGLMPFSGETVRLFFTKMEEQDFPALHHSKFYKCLYRPAYRVVAKQFLEEK